VVRKKVTSKDMRVKVIPASIYKGSQAERRASGNVFGCLRSSRGRGQEGNGQEKGRKEAVGRQMELRMELGVMGSHGRLSSRSMT
jgi:hypothetical protein